MSVKDNIDNLKTSTELEVEDELKSILSEIENRLENTKKTKTTGKKYLNQIKNKNKKITEVIDEIGKLVITSGEIISIDNRKYRDKNNFNITLYDGECAIGILAKNLFDREVDYLSDYLKKGNYVLVQGRIVYDDYLRENVLLLKNINLIDRPKISEDPYPEKRVELNVQTNMSEMDGIFSTSELYTRIKNLGMRAVAVNDNSSFHSIPEMYNLIKEDIKKKKKKPEKYEKLEIPKVVYGYQANLYDDTFLPVNVSENFDFSGEFVAFDIETTGLRNYHDHIIEIAAVRINNFAVTESFSTFVATKKTLSDFTKDLTGITDRDLIGAPSIEKAIKMFLDFAGDNILVAHNASFDCGFIREISNKFGYEFNNEYIDTLALSRLLMKNMKRHRLNQVAKKLKIKQEQHHRALDDTIVCAKIFIRFLIMLKMEKITTVDGINKLADRDYYLNYSRSFPVNIFPKDTDGLKLLYKVVSEANLEYIRSKKVYFPLSKLESLEESDRKKIMIGCGGAFGELADAINIGLDKKSINRIASRYDYFEIQPIGNYGHFFDKNAPIDKKIVIRLHEKIIALAKEMDKIVVATSSVKYLDKKDYVFRNILRDGQNKNLSLEAKANYYFRTTSEMLAEFEHLGTSAYDYVVVNTNKIADMQDEITPIPEGKHPPFIEGSDERLRNACINRIKEQYGETPDKIITDRIEFELDSIINNGYGMLYIASQIMTKESEKRKYIVGSRGSVGSSFAANMAGISEVNPLPPHYYCSKCYYCEFTDTLKNKNGFDMPDKDCPNCGTLLNKDGFNIPFESFMGFDGKKEPDIDLNFSGRIQGDMIKFTEEIFGEEYVFRSGTVTTIADKTAFGYVKKYSEKLEVPLSKRNIEAYSNKIMGVKRSTGQHPGGTIVIPNNNEVFDFTPINYPANDPSTDSITTHFDYNLLKGKLLKLDILSHRVPTFLHDLQISTGVDPKTIRLDDEEVLSLFSSSDALKLNDHRYKISKGTLGIPEFGTGFVMGILDTVNPKTLEDLINISGLSHGINVWTNNAEDLVKNNVVKFSEVISTREQVMLYAIEKGISEDIAFALMEKVKKGKNLSKEEIRIMKEHDIADWYIDSCNKIQYMFPRAHAIAYVLVSFRIAYYKLNYPCEYYATYLSEKITNFDPNIMLRGIDKVYSHLEDGLEKYATKKEQSVYSLSRLIYELYSRGIEFLPIDLYKSDGNDFICENGKIRPPLRAVAGLSEQVAENIVATRDEGYLSIEDLQKKTKLNSATIEAMKEEGCLDHLNETNQIDILSFM